MDDPRSIPSSLLPNSGPPDNSESDAGSDELRDILLVRLIFAARRLAKSRLQVATVPASLQSVCRECGAAGTDPTHNVHCKTGVVLGILDELMSLAPTGLGNGKAVSA